jgi:hypothetical protein
VSRSPPAEFRRFGLKVVLGLIVHPAADAAGLVAIFRGRARRAVVIASADVHRAYGQFLGLDGGPVEPTPLVEESPLRTILLPYRRQAAAPGDLLQDHDRILVESIVLGRPDLPGTVLRLRVVHGPGDPFRPLSSYLMRRDDNRPAIVLDKIMADWSCPLGYAEDAVAAIALAVVDHRAARRVSSVAEPRGCAEAERLRRMGMALGRRGRVVTAPRGRTPVSFDAWRALDTDFSPHPPRARARRDDRGDRWPGADRGLGAAPTARDSTGHRPPGVRRLRVRRWRR